MNCAYSNKIEVSKNIDHEEDFGIPKEIMVDSIAGYVSEFHAEMIEDFINKSHELNDAIKYVIQSISVTDSLYRHFQFRYINSQLFRDNIGVWDDTCYSFLNKWLDNEFKISIDSSKVFNSKEFNDRYNIYSKQLSDISIIFKSSLNKYGKIHSITLWPEYYLLAIYSENFKEKRKCYYEFMEEHFMTSWIPRSTSPQNIYDGFSPKLYITKYQDLIVYTYPYYSNGELLYELSVALEE